MMEALESDYLSRQLLQFLLFYLPVWKETAQWQPVPKTSILFIFLFYFFYQQLRQLQLEYAQCDKLL